MLAEINSVRYVSGRHKPVKVVVKITDGIGIHIVGLADEQAKTSLLRIATALQHSGYKVPGKKIVITIEPAQGAIDGLPTKTTGSHFELPIALGILVASEQITFASPNRVKDFVILGELGLDGSIRPSYPILGQRVFEVMKSERIPGCIVPFQTATEMVINTPLAYSPEKLRDAVKILESEKGFGIERYIAWNSRKWKTIANFLEMMSR